MREMISGLHRRGGGFVMAKAPNTLLCSESEWRAEMNNRTEQNRLKTLLLQMDREERMSNKRLTVARRHMELYADNLKERRKTCVSYKTPVGGYEDRAPEDEAPSASVFMTQFYPRYLWERALLIPDDHDHPGGQRLHGCPICSDVCRLIRDYINWKKSMGSELPDFSLEPQAPESITPTPERGSSRHSRLHLSKPALVRPETLDSLTNVDYCIPKRAAHDCIYTPEPRPLSCFNSKFSKHKSRTSLENYIGNSTTIKTKLRTFLHRQKTFNARNPVPLSVKLDTDESYLQAQKLKLYSSPATQTYKTRARMLSETLEKLEIKPSDKSQQQQTGSTNRIEA